MKCKILKNYCTVTHRNKRLRQSDDLSVVREVREMVNGVIARGTGGEVIGW